MNPKPILLHTFSKGGSNLLWNLFQSHPSVVSSGGEIHESFQSPWSRIRTLIGTRSTDFWSINNTRERSEPSTRFGRFVSARLFEDQMDTLAVDANAWITPDRKYTSEEVQAARLVMKCHNGQVFLTNQLSKMFPNPYFVAMPRNAFALCEAYLRRGHMPTAEKFAAHYNAVVGRMIADAEKIPNYQIVRYEDLFGSEFEESLTAMFTGCELDVSDLNGMIRLKAKELDGDEATSLQDHWSASSGSNVISPGEKYWIHLNEIETFVDLEVNQRQADSLDSESRQIVEKACGPILEHLGYI